MGDENADDNTASLSSATETLKIKDKDNGDALKSDKVKSGEDRSDGHEPQQRALVLSVQHGPVRRVKKAAGSGASGKTAGSGAGPKRSPAGNKCCKPPDKSNDLPTMTTSKEFVSSIAVAAIEND